MRLRARRLSRGAALSVGKGKPWSGRYLIRFRRRSGLDEAPPVDLNNKLTFNISALNIENNSEVKSRAAAKFGVTQLRVLPIALIAFGLHTEAQAQYAARKEPNLANPCTYTIRASAYEVPVDGHLCWRAPAPYYSEYALLRCAPPYGLQELTLVKRADSRCSQYELR